MLCSFQKLIAFFLQSFWKKPAKVFYWATAGDAEGHGRTRILFYCNDWLMYSASWIRAAYYIHLNSSSPTQRSKFANDKRKSSSSLQHFFTLDSPCSVATWLAPRPLKQPQDITKQPAAMSLFKNMLSASFLLLLANQIIREIKRSFFSSGHTTWNQNLNGLTANSDYRATILFLCIRIITGTRHICLW